MPYAKPPQTGAFQADTDTLLFTYPQFYAAGDAIRQAANDLNNAVTKAISAFDGDTHKKLQTLGNNCVTNLQDLSGALNEIAARLHQSALAIDTTEGHNTRMF